MYFPYIDYQYIDKNKNIKEINLFISSQYKTYLKEMKNINLKQFKNLKDEQIKTLIKKTNVNYVNFSIKEILINLFIQTLYVIKRKENIQNYESNVLFGFDKHIIINDINLSENLLRLELGYSLRLDY